MENFLYAIKKAKKIKIVDIEFDLYKYSIYATTGDLLLTYDNLLGAGYYYLFCDLSKKDDLSWKSIKISEASELINLC